MGSCGERQIIDLILAAPQHHQHARAPPLQIYDKRIMMPAMMDERAEALRRRIALYRRYLRESVDATLASEYLREIAEAEAELEQITGRGTVRRD